MKKLFMVSAGDHLAARSVKAICILLTTLALGTMFWSAAPTVQAQSMSPSAMIESQLPQGQSVQTAAKADFLQAVCAAVQKYRRASSQIVRFAVDAHPEWKKEILRNAFRCLGTDDCRLLGRVLAAIIAGYPADAQELTELAAELAPGCASAYGDGKTVVDPGTDPVDDGNFENAPGNLNPPPGSIGGGGGQGNVIAVCFNGITRFFSPEGAEDFLNRNPGARLGACVVTQFQNN